MFGRKQYNNKSCRELLDIENDSGKKDSMASDDNEIGSDILSKNR